MNKWLQAWLVLYLAVLIPTLIVINVNANILKRAKRLENYWSTKSGVQNISVKSTEDYNIHGHNVYNGSTCTGELSAYPDLPDIRVSAGTLYDTKSLNIFKIIGQGFLKAIQRKSLYDTIQLLYELKPGGFTMSKILQIVEYQLYLCILVAVGVTTATMILIAYTLFWAMKLTGNVKGVECQSIADSEGPMRGILSFLLVMFTLFVLIGCMIAWVSNIHITNNVSEAEKHVQWTLNVTKNYIEDIEAQMTMLFLKQYRDIYLTILNRRVNESVHYAATHVYNMMADNVTVSYNQSKKFGASIVRTATNLKNLVAKYAEANKTIATYISEINIASLCIKEIYTSCIDQTSPCKDEDMPSRSTLSTISAEMFNISNVTLASNDATKIETTGLINERALTGYKNGIYFHAGGQMNMDVVFAGDPEYTVKCKMTERTIGALKIVDNLVGGEYYNDTITCSASTGCSFTNASTRLLGGKCCITLVPVVPKLANGSYIFNSTVCGNATDNQQGYRGNISWTVRNETCVWWSATELKFDKTDFVDQGFTYYHGFCRNPSNLELAIPFELNKKAWCYTNAENKTWQYCDVPYCPNETEYALASLTSTFVYPTCANLTAEATKGASVSSENFVLWQTTKIARKDAYDELKEAASEMNAQFDVIQEAFNETNEEFSKLKKEITESISGGSTAALFDKVRNIATIFVVFFCLMSACLAVAGVCIGYCNFSDVPPHLRSSGSNFGGSLIKVSSYWAAVMAIINLYVATVFFIPGSVFNFVCEDYNDSQKVFKLYDNEILVNYSILGKAVLSNGSHNMTFKTLFDECKDNRTLWVALGLYWDPNYDIVSMMSLNESLNVPVTYAALKVNDFSKYPIYLAELKATYELWNNSYGLKLPWADMKTNLEDPFLGSTIDDDYCKKLKKWGSKVPGDASEKPVACKEHFTESDETGVEDLCKAWVKDRDKMNNWVTEMKDLTTGIYNEWIIYNTQYLMDMMTMYEITDHNQLINISQPIIKDSMSYWQNISDNEINCFSWKMEEQLINEFTMCYPIFKIIDNTMNYFCDYMVTSMMLAWMSQGLLGLILALHMLVAGNLANYFLIMERRHTDDIPNDEKAKAFL